MNRKKLKRIIEEIKFSLCEILYFIPDYLVNFRPLSKEKTVDLIIKNKLSVSRYGDGEFHLLFYKNYKGIGFQQASTKLRDDLFNAFTDTNNKKLLICTSSFRSNIFVRDSRIHRKHVYVYRRRLYKEIKKHINKNYTYGHASIFRFYRPANYKLTNFEKTDIYIKKLKLIWDKKNVLIVEGELTKLGLGNEIFDNVKSIKRILCPSTNSYERINDIFNAVMSNLEGVDLILCALGPTASILASWISKKTDVQFIDIGHIDVIYLWYINRATECYNIEEKYVNEAASKTVIPISYDENEYNSQIICKIL